ncbi:hypothetical protein [Deinococcus sp. Marseille-Q6407]|uniref:hypothetical protein n=1 Tax=Deinococcus sp. Marseille-Q6407 TaxID=2969223 RepID=UPI0021BEE723|nr:hypothetical protein [Deinococcus sp. Marseille-Q6407]
MPRPVPQTTWRECPHCRYPMVRWRELAGEPEQLWVAWNPETSFLPLHWLILGGLLLLPLAFPGLEVLVYGGLHRQTEALRPSLPLPLPQ